MFRLKELRKSAGMNQETLANLIGVSRSTVAMWERGTDPGIEMLAKLANLLNVSSDELLGLPAKNNSFVASPKISETEREILDIFRSLNVAGQQWFTEFARMARDNPQFAKESLQNAAT